MYDLSETELSNKELAAIFKESAGISICLIGGWAAHYHVNENYKRAFGQDYMGSRDIDIFFDPKHEKEFEKVVRNRGFTKNGLPFRYEKIYDRESRKFISADEAKKKHVYNLIYIFLDLFSNKKTSILGSWSDIDEMKGISCHPLGGFSVADIDTLVALKCTALFARDKSDKENKDACDLYALLEYSNKRIKPTVLLAKAISKILDRPDLLYSIAEHVLLDPSKQSIAEVTLRDRLESMQDKAT
jgi:hypothetical protein